MLDAVDPHRKKFGLKTFAELRTPDGGEKENLLIQQKTETVDALSKIAQPCWGDSWLFSFCLSDLSK